MLYPCPEKRGFQWLIWTQSCFGPSAPWVKQHIALAPTSLNWNSVSHLFPLLSLILSCSSSVVSFLNFILLVSSFFHCPSYLLSLWLKHWKELLVNVAKRRNDHPEVFWLRKKGLKWSVAHPQQCHWLWCSCSPTPTFELHSRSDFGRRPPWNPGKRHTGGPFWSEQGWCQAHHVAPCWCREWH